MISPADQKIIQIDVTNACRFSCANCTRFCGHHKAPFYMELDIFKRSVESLKGFSGMIGVMGGEPTMHPQFGRIVDCVRSLQPNKNLGLDARGPIDDFGKWRNKFRAKIPGKFGLWTSLGPRYYRNFEAIQEAFDYQCVNDHAHKGEHIALMLPHDELGFSRDEFVRYRDNCWIQRLWSASITPKGAFFCEVAGALDMLFGGPGGWPVEPGWWQRKPEDFGDQLKWCDICSACLPVPKVTASSGRDLVSPRMRDWLEDIDSPKLAKGKVDVLDLSRYDRSKFKANNSCEPYLPLEGNSARVSSTNGTVKPKTITAVVVCVNYDDYLSLTLPRNIPEVDRIIVITDEEDAKTKACAESHGAEVFVSSRIHQNGAPLAKGKAINDLLTSSTTSINDWILMLDADVILPKGFRKIKDMVLNPGVLYFARRFGPEFPEMIKPFMADLVDLDYDELFEKWASKEVAKFEGRRGNAVEAYPFGYFQLFNFWAETVQTPARVCSGIVYNEGSNTAEHDDRDFGQSFPKHKRVQLPSPAFDVIHLPHGMFKVNWQGRVSPRIDSFKPAHGPGRRNDQRKFKCVNRCVWNGRVYKEGETVSVKNELPPRHFVQVA